MTNKNIPNIRFKEFEEEWEDFLFSEIVERISNTSSSKILPKIEYEDIISGVGELNKDVSQKLDDRKGIHFQPNYILYGKLRPYLNNWLLPKFEGIALGDFWVFSSKDNFPEFIYYLIQTNPYQKVANDTSGTKMPRSDWKSVSNTILNIPNNIDEQSAIGSLFCTLDGLISSYKANLSHYQTFKATMLSKMFPKAGQTVPEIRLEGFEGEWEVVRLDSVFGKIRNAFVGTATPYYVEKGNLYLESNNIKNGNINFNSQVFINDEFYKMQEDKWLKTGDLVMVQSGHVGHTAVIPKELNNISAHALIMFTDYVREADPYFINYQFLTTTHKKKLNIISTGNTIKHILASEMKGYQIYFSDIDEQQAIGSFFSNLDDVIASYQAKIEQLETLKKKLLQEMFV